MLVLAQRRTTKGPRNKTARLTTTARPQHTRQHTLLIHHRRPRVDDTRSHQREAAPALSVNMGAAKELKTD